MKFAKRFSNLQVHYFVVRFIRGNVIFMKRLNFLDYQALDTELDKLDSCLSVIEGWNENLQSECVKLLERTKELRQQMASQT